MLPRGNLDIGWRDLGFALTACFRPGGRDDARRLVASAWPTDRGAVCALSVRSGFDTLLTALSLPAGGEVLTSALTIEDMPRIIAHHGLVPVPVDLDMAALKVRIEDLERSIGPRTCAVLVAHLFGSRMPLDDIIAFARRHGLVVIEDCAQAYVGRTYEGHPDSDVAMFSFGSIKTNTALGGAILTIKDPALLEAMRRVQSAQPVQSRQAFLRKVMKYATIKLLSSPTPYGALAAACRALGTDHDVVISKALRGFSGPDFFARIRHQPSYPLLALLERRLRTFDLRRIERRTRLSESLRERLPSVGHVGTDAGLHSHWVFPVTSPAPDLLVRHLWRRGFDATRGRTSLAVVAPPRDRPELAAAQAASAFSGLVYLPVHVDARPADLTRLCRAVCEVEGRDK